MLKILIIIGAVGGLVAAGVVEGMRSNRWGDSAEIKNSATRLTAIPSRVGHWVAIEERTMDPQIQRIAGAVGYVDRCYRNENTGEIVDVLLLSGTTGSIAAHTPDICFQGLGYSMKESAPVRRTLSVPDGMSVSYWSARFEKDQPGSPSLLVNWAWGVNGDWSAADAPRREFLLHQSLYKLYVTRRVSSDRDAAEDVEGFLKEFVPAVKTVLMPQN